MVDGLSHLCVVWMVGIDLDLQEARVVERQDDQ